MIDPKVTGPYCIGRHAYLMIWLQYGQFHMDIYDREIGKWTNDIELPRTWQPTGVVR